MQAFKQKFRFLLLMISLLAYLPLVSYASQGELVYCTEANGQIQLEWGIEEVEHLRAEAVRAEWAQYFSNKGPWHSDQILSLTAFTPSIPALNFPLLGLVQPFAHPLSEKSQGDSQRFFTQYLIYSPFLQANRTIVLLN